MEIKNRTCLYCGAQFIMPPIGSAARSGEVKAGIYCSRTCRWSHVKDIHNSWPQCKVYFKPCEICGKLYVTRRKVKHWICSDACRKKYMGRICFKSNKKKKAVAEIACKKCGKIFMPKYGDKRKLFCSSRCNHSYYSAISRPMRRARRKALKKSVTVERVNPAEVFMRDGWRCQICGKKLNQINRGTYKNMAPELDHIIPLSQGGEHSYKNTQCTCRKCNGKKGGEGRGQQLLLIGI